jgi:hypothetical protein
MTGHGKSRGGVRSVQTPAGTAPTEEEALFDQSGFTSLFHKLGFRVPRLWNTVHIAHREMHLRKTDRVQMPTRNAAM